MSKVLIDADELRDLLKARYELLLLECAGVDCWGGYDLTGEDSGMQSLSDFLNEIEEASDKDLLKYL